MTIYGINNCSTVKKALNWLNLNNIEYQFHDYKKLGIKQEILQKWCDKFGWENVLNKSGMMWRKADQQEKTKVTDKDSAIAFMMQIPSSIKRPIVEYKKGLLKGFDEKQYEKAFLK